MNMFNQEDPAIENLWKMCGRDTECGRLMYKFYGSHYKPKVSYPKVKVKTPAQKAEEKMAKEAKKTFCPQKTKIEYPEPPRREQVNDAIKYVPRKKTKAMIEKELTEARRGPLVKPSPGVNRGELIDQLQEQYQFSSGILPKSVQSSEIKFEKKPGKKTETWKKPVKPPIQASDKPKTQAEELDELFLAIQHEIEERQEHLEFILKDGKNPEIEKRIKNEIASRLGELQKITELKQALKF